MPCKTNTVGQTQFVHLLADRLHIRPLACKHEGKCFPALRIAGAAFEDALDILLPVHLPAVEQNRFVRQVKLCLCGSCARRARVNVRCAVWHDDHLADIAIVIECLLGALTHGPDFVAALVKIHDGCHGDVCEHLCSRDLVEIVIVT
ncbi:hypothetical protein SDC9_189932 [bioreactor metagenome]|uniref:Uncharacterized protein n=1 Tax=bioreactor metagenome TaxID=1076179 RepID=A0A645HTI3_9ZZZZ